VIKSPCESRRFRAAWQGKFIVTFDKPDYTESHCSELGYIRQEHLRTKAAQNIFLLTVAVFSMGFATAFVKAQQPGRPADTTNPERVRQQDQSRRELQLRNLASQAEAGKDLKRIDQLAAEIEHDFQRILILHNELARFILNNKPLDYDVVFEATAEIRKRALHLQKTLALNKPDNEQNQEKRLEFPDQRIKEAVATLCNEIKSFVTNPIINHPGIVNAPELMRARRDLQDVIDLSDNLKKSADRLKKFPQ
jgi:hypothetical protein